MRVLFVRSSKVWKAELVREANEPHGLLDIIERRFALYDSGVQMKDTYMFQGDWKAVETKLTELNSH